MPSLLVDRSVQKQCDKLFTTDTLIQYGILIGSSTNRNGSGSNISRTNEKEEQDIFCVVGAIPVLVDDPTPSVVPTNQILSNAEKIAASLCGGLQVVGVYVFVRATSRDSSLLSNLESALNSFPSFETKHSSNIEPKIASDKIALQITSNHASARILSSNGGTGRQADIKFSSLAEQYVFLQSSLTINIQLCGDNNKKATNSYSLSSLYGDNELFHKFDNNMIVQVDNKYMPTDIAKNIPIGHLPYKDIHNVVFYPERSTIIGSNNSHQNNNNNNNRYVRFNGTFHFKAYIFEKNTTERGLELLLNDFKSSVKKRCEMCSLPDKDSEKGIIDYIPIRYDVTSPSTVLSKCFSSYFVLSKDNDVMDGVDDIKEEFAQIGINVKEVNTTEYISTNDDSPINILGKGKGGKARALRVTSDGENINILKKGGKVGNDSGDVNVNFSAGGVNEEAEEDFEIEDITGSEKVENSEKTGGNNAAGSNDSNVETNTLKKNSKKDTNSNMPLLFVVIGFLVVLLAVVMMIMKPANSK